MDSKIKDALHCIYNESVKNPPKTLDGHIKNEIGIVNDYRGRAIYEFFQNAIDRAESKIWIHLDKSKKTLTIANDGKSFSIDKEGRNYSDLESLCSINTSSKNQNESIGNKGVGFKSCWEYTSKVSVCSTFEDKIHWGFEMHNPLTIDEIATIDSSIVKQWIKNEDYFTVFENNERKVPSFYYPLPIDNADCYFNSYVGAKTVITFLDLNENKIYDLEEKIHEFSEHYIFFVNQLDKLKNSNIELELIIDETVIKTLNTCAAVDEWLIVNKTFDGEELTNLQKLSANLNYEIKLPKIAIAFPLKQEKVNDIVFHSNFYCYLPTEMECGFNVLIHGDFLLDVSRKQIDFNNNSYNKKLLEHIAKLYVDTLMKKIELHSLSYFGKFLLPLNRGGRFESLIRNKLFNENVITEILKKVYTKERNWEIESYLLIFKVLNVWQREKTEKFWDDYYNNIYTETVKYFCDPDVLIVPIFENNSLTSKKSLPQKESKTKLFFRKENNNISGSEILEQFESITISSFNELESLKSFGIIKDFSKIEIVRTLNNEIKENKSEEIFEKILTYLIGLNQDLSFKNGIQLYLSGDSIERQLAKIHLPCKDNEWHPAIQCFVNIAPEISKSFKEGFFEIDIEKFKEIGQKSLNTELSLDLELGKFGVWNSKLPILHENGKYTLPFNDLPKLKNNYLKLLINNSCSEWQNINGKNDLLDPLNSVDWFYNEINKTFTYPSKVFLFNDSRVRKCIAQERKADSLKDLYIYLNIRSIEDTDDYNKLVNQLEVMKDRDVDENHKTVYKQIVLRLSRLKNDNIKNRIPLLTTQANYIDSECWFIPTDQRKYIYHFPNYNFVNFDVNTALNFIENLDKVKRFNAEFTIKPNLNELNKDLKIKEFLEQEYLHYFFALAENGLSSLNFDKEKCISRWSNLDIYYADDVWLEVHFNNIKIELYKGEKKDVLYKPLNKSTKDTDESVGTLAHDLVDIKNNPNVYKFGYAIAEAVFRDQNFGEVLSNFIQKMQFDSNLSTDFLRERGIEESDINESIKFIQTNVINDSDLNDFIKDLNEKYKLNLSINNWRDLEQYTYLEFFTKIEIDKTKSKFVSLLNLINPYKNNKMFLSNSENKREIQIAYYASNNNELSDNVYETLSMDDILYSFDIKKNIYKQLGIDLSTVTEERKMSAEVFYQIKDIVKQLDISNLETNPILKSQDLPTINISNEGNEKISVKKTSTEQRESTNRLLHERGNSFERILALKYEIQIIENKQFENFKEKFKKYVELNGSDLMTFDLKLEKVGDIANILQVSKSFGDGLGYDVLKPIFENGKLIDFNFVEVKSSKNNTSIHLSENEREKILHFANNDINSWRLYHFVDGRNYDRTEVVRNAVKEHAKSYTGEQLLVGVDWMITFKNN